MWDYDARMCDIVTYRTTGNLTSCRTYATYKWKTKRFLRTRKCYDEPKDAMRSVQGGRRSSVFLDVLSGIDWTQTIFPTHIQDHQNASSKNKWLNTLCSISRAFYHKEARNRTRTRKENHVAIGASTYRNHFPFQKVLLD